MKFSIKHHPIGKPEQISGSDLTFNWKACDYSQQQLVAHALAGKPLAVATYKGGHRKGENFKESCLIIADIDHGSNPDGLTATELEQVLGCEVVNNYAFAVYPTFSSRAGAYRLRVCFQLDYPVTDGQLYRDLVAALLSLIPFADTAAKDAARAFYGSERGSQTLAHHYGMLLPISFLEGLVEQLRQRREAIRAKAAHFDGTPDLEEVRRALSFTPPVTNYETWVKVIAAVWSTYPGSEGVSLIKQWSPGKSGEVEAKFKAGFDGSIGLGTLFHIAKEYGYQMPRRHAGRGGSAGSRSSQSETQGTQVNDHDAIHLSERFITNANLDLTAPRCWAIGSPIGTGKTEAYIKAIQPGSHVLIVSHRVTLAAGLTRRMNEKHDLGFDYYRDFAGTTTCDYLRSAPRLVISYNSLHKLLGKDGSLPAHYDMLILDECEQGLEHLTGSTFARAEGVSALAILSQLVKITPNVIAADAGISRLTTDWLASFRSDVTRIWNTYPMQRGGMEIYGQKAPVYLRLLADLQSATAPIVIATDSKIEAKTIHQFLQENGFRGVCVHADNKDEPENRTFLANLDNELAQVDYLVHSPTIDAGIDIQTHVDSVYGFFLNQTVTAPGQLQMLGRARKAQRFVVFSAKVGQRLDLNPHKIKRRIIRTLAQNHHTMGLPLEWDEKGNTVLDDKRNAYLDLAVNVEAKRNRLLSYAHETFTAWAAREFAVTVYENEEGADGITVKERLREIRRTRQKFEMDRVLTADPVGEDEYRRLQLDGKATELVNAGHFRFTVENFYKQIISEDLYKEATNRSNGGKKRLDLFILAHKPSEVLRMRDLEQQRGETWTADHQRQNYSTKLPALKAALSVVFGDHLHIERFDKEAFVLLVNAFKQESERLELGRLFKRRQRKANENPTKEGFKLLRWALSLLGLRLKLWRGRDGKREYSIDPDRYQEVIELANTRLAGLEDEQRITGGMVLRFLAVESIASDMPKSVTEDDWGRLLPSERLNIALPPLKKRDFRQLQV